jgi:hypothetical protein
MQQIVYSIATVVTAWLAYFVVGSLVVAEYSMPIVSRATFAAGVDAFYFALCLLYTGALNEWSPSSHNRWLQLWLLPAATFSLPFSWGIFDLRVRQDASGTLIALAVGLVIAFILLLGDRQGLLRRSYERIGPKFTYRSATDQRLFYLKFPPKSRIDFLPFDLVMIGVVIVPFLL